MRETFEDLKHQLQILQFKLAESEARFAPLDVEYQTTVKQFKSCCEQIEHAKREWMTSLDVIDDPIFLHDENFHILRCNRAYQRCAGIPFEQLIGQPYYEIFPKTHTPLPNCLKAHENTETEFTLGDTTYRSRAYDIKDVHGAYLYSIHSLEDISKHIRVQRQLQESEQRYRRLFESAKDGLLILDGSSGKIMDANPFFLNLLEFSLDEIKGKTLWKLGLIADNKVSKKIAKELLSKQYIRYANLQLISKDGRFIDVEFLSNFYEVGESKLIHCNIRDISENLRAQKSLKLFRTLLDNSSDAIEVIDPATMNYLDVNDTACRDLGYSRKEMLSMNVAEVDLLFDQDLVKTIEEQTKQSGQAQFESVHQRKDGSSFPVEVSLKNIEIDKPYILTIVRNITERKHSEQVLLEQKTFTDTLVKSLPDIFFLVDSQSRLLQWNKQFEELVGLPPKEMLGYKALSFIHKKDKSRVAQQLEQAFETGKASVEASMILKNGERDYMLTGNRVNTQHGVCVIGIGLDITERKQAEERLMRANRALETLSAANLALLRATSEQDLLHLVTSAIEQNNNYQLATVCYAEDDPQKSITPIAWSTNENEYYFSEKLSWADTEQGQLPIAEAIRSGQVQLCPDIANYSGYALWKKAALAHGYASNIVLPLINHDKTFGGLSIYSNQKNAFDSDEIKLLEELASDMAFGISTIRTRIKHEEQTVLLRQNLVQTIETIAGTMEAHDPYTAGHQRRVGELATAIARDMHLLEEQVSAIHLAAIIHDLGKIRVPTEILAKPGKLTEIEFMLIKTHPQTGYDIMKDVKLPWPIAEIILQHHEKLDGSGYPRGLKGEEIMLESRIITVADVVEAMSSHRPYRASLGYEQALNEIKRGRGVEYDSAVVDSCLKLFNERGFQFND